MHELHRKPVSRAAHYYLAFLSLFIYFFIIYSFLWNIIFGMLLPPEFIFCYKNSLAKVWAWKEAGAGVGGGGVA